MTITQAQQFWLDSDFVFELLKQIPASVFWKDKNSVYLGCNNAFARSLGLSSPEEIIGKTDYDLPTAKEDSDAFRADDKQVIESKQPKLNIEERQTLSDGRKVILLTNKVPLLDKEKNVIGVLCIYYDITERKKAEEELRRAKENAETANQLRAEFIRNMQHDIRTPVGGVRTLLGDMAETMQDDDLRKKLILMRDGVEQLEIICNEVIDFDKVEHGNSPVIAKKFDIHALIKNVISLNKTAAFVKKLTLDAHIADNVPRVVKGDDHRTLRILINLIGNAVKFTKEGSIALTADLAQQKDKQLIIKFVIKDTGIGIPEEKRELIYEKFSRLNPSNQGIYKGSGLGLRIVKQFVEELEGEIDVQSKEGEGTSFHVILPFEACLLQEVHDVPAQIAPFLGEKASIAHMLPLRARLDSLLAKKPAPTTSVSPEPAHKTEQAATTADNQKRIRILLIEDDSIALMIQQRYLTEQGFDVQTAGNVEDALAILDVTPFDAVLSDFGLPDGDGADIIRHVKDNPQSLNYSIPFYCCTAHTDPKIIKGISDSGFFWVLSKPFRPGQAEALAIDVREKQEEAKRKQAA